jgi:hypothetical protein
VQAVTLPLIDLTLPANRRRTIDFRRDVLPILSDKCALVGCHATGDYPPDLDGETRAYQSLLSVARFREDAIPLARYVDPGRARTSPLVWSLLGQDTSRPWDPSRQEAGIQMMPPPGSERLTDSEIRTIAEWIDLGALLNTYSGKDETRGVR